MGRWAGGQDDEDGLRRSKTERRSRLVARSSTRWVRYRLPAGRFSDKWPSREFTRGKQQLPPPLTLITQQPKAQSSQLTAHSPPLTAHRPPPTAHPRVAPRKATRWPEASGSAKV